MFITFEGIDGSGKTVQLACAADYLKTAGKQVIITREPGTISYIRDCVLSKDIDIRTETLLYSADRAENIAKNVLPALNEGKIVLQDRYLDSFLAYQGNEFKNSDLMQLAEFSSQGLVPDLTFLLDLDPKLAQTRLGRPDRIEKKPIDFHIRVRDAYLKLALSSPDRIKVIDASQNLTQVGQMVIHHIQQKLAAQCNSEAL